MSEPAGRPGTQAASSNTELERSDREQRLRGALGTWDIVFTVLAYNAPLTTVIAVLPLIVSIGNGLSAPLFLLVAAGLMLLFSVGFTEMARRVDAGGAFYSYICLGIGRSVGLGAAVIAIMGYTFFLIGNYIYIGDVAQRLLQPLELPISIPAWGWTMVIAAAVSVLGYRNITLSAKILTYALLLEVLLVVAWDIAIATRVGIPSLSARWLVSESHSRKGSIGVGLLLAVTCFAGFEATAIFRDEAINPNVTVPRGTYVSIVLMGILFSAAAYFFIVGFGPSRVEVQVDQQGIAAPLQSIREYLGAIGEHCAQILLLSSLFAAILSLHNILARYVFVLSRDGVFPASLMDIHNSHGSPYRASVIVTVLGSIALTALIYTNYDPYTVYSECAGMAGYVLLILQILTSAAVISFFRSNDDVSMWKKVLAPAASVGMLCWTLCIATAHIDVIVGSGGAAKAMVSSIYAVFVLGICWACLLRRFVPEKYGTIGRQSI